MDTTDLLDDYELNLDELKELEEADVTEECFNCLGDVNSKYIILNKKGYFYSKEGHLCETNPHILLNDGPGFINMFGKSWDRGSCLLNNLEDLFKMASMELMILESSANVTFGTSKMNQLKLGDVDKSFFVERNHCIALCKFIRDYIKRLYSKSEYQWMLSSFVVNICRKLRSLRKQLGKIIYLPDHVYNYCANSSGNRCTQASYHLIHAHLDLRWLNLSLMYILSEAKQHSNSESSSVSTFEEKEIQIEVDSILTELFHLAVIRFNKIDCKDIFRKTPFSCTCIQEFWIILRQFADKEAKKCNGKIFWTNVDMMISSITGLNSFDNTSEEERAIVPNDVPLFCIWFLCSIAQLYTYDEGEVISNYPLLESVLKFSFNFDVKESDLRIYIHFVEKIILEFWEPKTEPILIMWEYYQKRLNDSFYIGGSSLDSISIIAKSAFSLLSQVKSRLEKNDNIVNSYHQFLRILGVHLIRSKENPRHWNLLKGRVYSKISPPKVVLLNQIGEYHVVSLFLTLAVSGHLSQVADKFVEVFDTLLKEKGSISLEILKGGLALVILSAERNIPVHKILMPITGYISSLDPQENKEIFKIFIEAMGDVLDSNNSFLLGQHVFIDSWIIKYLRSCSINEASRLLDVLLSIIIKIKPTSPDPGQDSIVLIEKLWDQLYDYLKKCCGELTTPCQIADISANLSYIFFKLCDSSRYNEILSLFYKNDSCDIRLVRRYLCLLIQFEEIKQVLPDMNAVIVKTWLRSCLVCNDVNHFEIKQLNSLVSNLPEVKAICLEYSSDLTTSEEPLLEFFSALHSKYENISNIFERQSLREQFATFTSGMDKWVKPFLSPPQSLDVVERLFFLIGNLLRLVSPLLYQKSKANNLLQSLINLTLLPSSIHNPEVKIHSFILCASRKTLHLFLEGLIKLGPENDHYINRCIQEIVTVYVPKCLSNTGPLCSQIQASNFSLISLFNEFNTPLATVIVDNLCAPFLKTKVKTSHPNAIYALIYLREVLNLHGHVKRVLLLLIENSFGNVLNTVMFADENSGVNIMAKDVTKLFLIKVNDNKTQEISDSVVHVLSKVTSENLAWSSRQTIDMLCYVAFYSPNCVSAFSPTLLTIVKGIEVKRGIGYDRLLRIGYERVQNKILSVKEDYR